MKERKISQIKEGTVLDHLDANRVFQIISLLNLDKSEYIVSCALNLESSKLGKKGIIKVGNKFFTTEEVNMISIIAPNATLCIIKDYEVESKRRLEIPQELHNVLCCINPKCITNHEQVSTHFKVLSKTPLKVKCIYCENVMFNQELKIKGDDC